MNILILLIFIILVFILKTHHFARELFEFQGLRLIAKKEYFKPTGIAISEQFDDDDSEVPF
jgi:hypothetical protein